MFLYNIIVFLLWPFIGFVIAVQNLELFNFRLFILLFILIASFTILPYSDGDIRLYQDVYDNISRETNISFFNLLNAFSLETGNFELYIPLNVYLVSRFSENIALSYAFTGLVYYFFWINIVKELFVEIKQKVNTNKNLIFILFIFFSMYIMLYRVVNGRFYLAYWVSILSIYHILYNKKNHYYLFLIISILIHQSFIFIVGLFLIFKALSSFIKHKHFDLIFIFSFILGVIYSELSIDFIRNNLEIIFGGEKYSDYIKESYIQSINERDRKWFLIFRTPFLFYLGYVLLIRLRYSQEVIFSKGNYLLFKFILIFSVLNAWTINIPSFGERFRNVLIGFIILLILKIFIENNNIKYKNHFILFLVSFAFYKLVSFRVFSEYINLYAFAPLSLFFDYFDPKGYSLHDLIY